MGQVDDMANARSKEGIAPPIFLPDRNLVLHGHKSVGRNPAAVVLSTCMHFAITPEVPA